MKQKKRLIRVVVVQSSCVLHKSIADILKSYSWIEVCATAESMNEIGDMIDLYKPQVVITNISMKSNSTFSMIQRLKQDFFWLSVVAFSCDSEFEGVYVNQALKAGVSGYLCCGDSEQDLLKAVSRAARGKTFVGRAAQSQESQLLQEIEELSSRELEVFCLTGCGHMTQGVSEILKVGTRTIDSFKERIRKKMGFSSSAELLYASVSFMRAAARQGLGGTDEDVIRELISATAA